MPDVSCNRFSRIIVSKRMLISVLNFSQNSKFCKPNQNCLQTFPFCRWSKRMIFANFMEDILQRLHFTFSINFHKFIQVDRNITESKLFYVWQQIVLWEFLQAIFLFSVRLCILLLLVDCSKRADATNKRHCRKLGGQSYSQHFLTIFLQSSAWPFINSLCW